MKIIDALVELLFNPDLGRQSASQQGEAMREAGPMDRFGRPMITAKELAARRVEFRRSLERTDY